MKYLDRMFIGISILFIGYIVGQIIEFITGIVGLQTMPTLIITLQMLVIVAYVLGCVAIEGKRMIFTDKKGR